MHRYVEWNPQCVSRDAGSRFGGAASATRVHATRGVNLFLPACLPGCLPACLCLSCCQCACLVCASWFQSSFIIFYLQPVTVLGHAYGNRVVRTLAALCPRKVSGVVILAAGHGNASLHNCPNGLKPFRIPAKPKLGLVLCFAPLIPSWVRKRVIRSVFFHKVGHRKAKQSKKRTPSRMDARLPLVLFSFSSFPRIARSPCALAGGMVSARGRRTSRSH